MARLEACCGGTNCRGAAQYKRVVEVVDSLKPVLALHLASKTIQMSDEVDERVPGDAGSSPKPNSSPNAAQAGRVPLATMVQDANGNWAPAAGQCPVARPCGGGHVAGRLCVKPPAFAHNRSGGAAVLVARVIACNIFAHPVCNNNALASRCTQPRWSALKFD